MCRYLVRRIQETNTLYITLASGTAANEMERDETNVYFQNKYLHEKGREDEGEGSGAATVILEVGSLRRDERSRGKGGRYKKSENVFSV